MSDPSDTQFLDQHVAALNDAADAMHDLTDVDTTLSSIVTQAQHTLPGIDHVGVSILDRSGRVSTVACTDDVVVRLDELQYGVGEGPCVSALSQAEIVVVEDARHEQRWPRFIAEAVRLGLRAQLGVRLYQHTSGVGVLNMYSFNQDLLDPHLPHLAELFARHAAHALGYARHSEQMESALETRSLIGQAMGIVMERYGLDEHRAFDYLARTSTTTNVKLRDVARGLVEEHRVPR